MKEPRIVTVTLSPLLERTLVTHYLALGYPNQSEGAERLDPAGGGVNIARALHRLGTGVHAVVLLGDDAVGLAYRGLIAEEGFPATVISVAGPTPSETCILDTGNEQETHIVSKGATVGEAEIREVLRSLLGIVVPGDTVVLAGPLPPGAPDDTYARLVGAVRGAGAEAVLATSGTALEAALPAGPQLAVLNQVECEGFCNYPVRVVADVVGCGQRLCEQGAGAALIEMGRADRAVLVSGEDQWQVEFPEGSEGTTTGIWEATLAGYLSGQLQRRPIPESLELGAAAAGYAADEVGARFGSADEVETYRADVEVKPVNDDE